MASTNRTGRRPFRDNKSKTFNKDKLEMAASEFDADNPLIAAFISYSKELDAKHDRYERIVKISRDITIESKRIIFLLHTIDSKKNNQKTVLEEAHKRLHALINNNFLAIAKDLGNLDIYQYIRAYSAGLQEFIEAYTFYEFFCGNKLSDWQSLQNNMNYEITSGSVIIPPKAEGDQIEEEHQSKIENSTSHQNEKIKVCCFIPPSEYMLGVADLTGEIMRRCINSLGSNDLETCFISCGVLKDFYTGYLGINSNRQKELNRKIYTLKQSLLKTENVAYNVKVRGGEAALWGTINDVYNSEKHEDVDEGYY